MSIDDKAITSTHILHLSRSKLIQHNTLCDVTLTGIGVVWWHLKDYLGALTDCFHGYTCKGRTSNYSTSSQCKRLTHTK